jgi:hypothetical protein
MDEADLRPAELAHEPDLALHQLGVFSDGSVTAHDCRVTAAIPAK